MAADRSRTLFTPSRDKYRGVTSPAVQLSVLEVLVALHDRDRGVARILLTLLFADQVFPIFSAPGNHLPVIIENFECHSTLIFQTFQLTGKLLEVNIAAA